MGVLVAKKISCVFLTFFLIALMPCMAMAKESRPSLEGKVIILDPGHGGSDSGATAKNLTEKSLNLAVALRLEALLKKAKATVYMTRRDDRDVSLEERVRFFHRYDAQAIISIHHNAKPYDEKADEVSVYRPSFATPEAKRLAKIVSQELVKSTGNPRGALGPVDYYILVNSKSLPIVIAEPYFLTNKEHVELLQKEETLQLQAEAYYQALVLFFDETYEIK